MASRRRASHSHRPPRGAARGPGPRGLCRAGATGRRRRGQAQGHRAGCARLTAAARDVRLSGMSADGPRRARATLQPARRHARGAGEPPAGASPAEGKVKVWVEVRVLAARGQLALPGRPALLVLPHEAVGGLLLVQLGRAVAALADALQGAVQAVRVRAHELAQLRGQRLAALRDERVEAPRRVVVQPVVEGQGLHEEALLRLRGELLRPDLLDEIPVGFYVTVFHGAGCGIFGEGEARGARDEQHGGRVVLEDAHHVELVQLPANVGVELPLGLARPLQLEELGQQDVPLHELIRVVAPRRAREVVELHLHVLREVLDGFVDDALARLLVVGEVAHRALEWVPDHRHQPHAARPVPALHEGHPLFQHALIVANLRVRLDGEAREDGAVGALRALARVEEHLPLGAPLVAQPDGALVAPHVPPAAVQRDHVHSKRGSPRFLNVTKQQHAAGGLGGGEGREDRVVALGRRHVVQADHVDEGGGRARG
mmetsp:Transcript_3885/g.13017  ORF Transcript_3885/g.13017 Transcript_3885/m.13017 type:complete len:487 (+) Transcript_3885:676-2136(+)